MSVEEDRHRYADGAEEAEAERKERRRIWTRDDQDVITRPHQPDCYGECEDCKEQECEK